MEANLCAALERERACISASTAWHCCGQHAQIAATWPARLSAVLLADFSHVLPACALCLSAQAASSVHLLTCTAALCSAKLLVFPAGG